MADPKFVIQGTDYPVPEWISFTMDESEILYDKAKMTLDQADEDLVFTPGLLSALMLIAYMRGNPGVTRARAEKIIGAVPLADAIEHLAGEDEEEDAGPPSPAPSETDIARRARKERRIHAIYWRTWRERFGEPGRPAATYWDARIGHAAHIRPCDVGVLTPYKLMECADLFDSIYAQGK